MQHHAWHNYSVNDGIFACIYGIALAFELNRQCELRVAIGKVAMRLGRDNIVMKSTDGKVRKNKKARVKGRDLHHFQSYYE
jgi:hypothetical protein